MIPCQKTWFRRKVKLPLRCNAIYLPGDMRTSAKLSTKIQTLLSRFCKTGSAVVQWSQGFFKQVIIHLFVNNGLKASPYPDENYFNC
jgi:hypothetical protein